LELRVETDSTGTRVLHLAGRLDADTAGGIWNRAVAQVPAGGQPLALDARRLSYCDGVGISLLLDLECHQRRQGGSFEVRHLPPDVQQLLDMGRSHVDLDAPAPGPKRPSLVEVIGARAELVIRDVGDLVTWVGHMTQALWLGLLNPTKVRWGDFLYTCTAAGVFALPVVLLLGFLLGWIMSFQAAYVMRDYGADRFLATLIGPTMVRELGPLMTTVVLAARSGSAFAASIGTMKVNEEVDALYTMGLDPVRFLVTPKVLAAIVVTPLLTAFCSLSGIVGGAVVSVTILNLPLEVYTNQLLNVIHVNDIGGGMVKAMIFGILVAAIGCIRGLQTRQSPTAVGESTTSAVVSGIVLIAIADAILAVIYRILDI
ncbi:MAG: ABC transporter permease, partial [Planctomycetota bacterium]